MSKYERIIAGLFVTALFCFITLYVDGNMSFYQGIVIFYLVVIFGELVDQKE